MSNNPVITSRDNPLVKELKKLAQDNTAYRKQGRFWVEGDHLIRAARTRGVTPELLVVSESFDPAAHPAIDLSAAKSIAVGHKVFQEISGLASPATLGAVFALPTVAIQADVNTVVLDRVQDAGNVGSILRSAAGFGFKQVLAIKGTAALWSPKVLRAGMGAHFGLSLLEGLDESDLQGLNLPMLVTSSHQGEFIHRQTLPSPCAWVMGHEGQGVSSGLMARAAQFVRIAQPGGEESLNVAAAAAICLHASATLKAAP
jgi:TrmH family RNA methyltransferase